MVAKNIPVGLISNLVSKHQNSVVGLNAHPSPNYFNAYYAVNPFDGGIQYNKLPNNVDVILPGLTVVSDPASKVNNGDWYGASGAYRQADADSTSTKIEDDDAVFTADIVGSIVHWASNAGGSSNKGYGVVTGYDVDTLTIVKCDGVDFASSYYYWIKHAGWIVPVTGIYLMTMRWQIVAPEDGMLYINRFLTSTAHAAPVVQTQVNSVAASTGEFPSIFTLMLLLTKNDEFMASLFQTGTTGVPGIKVGSAGRSFIFYYLLQQTA
jgi:hypothetical protein